MRDEDTNSAFEEALSKIEPRDEEHKAKLEKLRQMMKASSAESKKIVEKAQSTQENLTQGHDRSKQIALDRAQLAIDFISAIQESFDEHTDIILKRIVMKT